MDNKTTKDVAYVTPLKKICMTIGELPTSYLETMSYYEMLVWFTNFLRDNIIPAVNNNAEAVQELQTLYEQLRSYVENYFDNLDVQEEIDNKLDEMAESGQLTDIIAQYLGLAGMIAFDTVADMKLAENLVNGSKCRTLGFHSVNDGGGAYYKIRTVTNDDVVDEMTIIEVYDNLLVAELIIDNEINVLQLGAKPNDNTFNNYTVLNKAFNMDNTPVYIPYGSYYITQQLQAIKAKKIHGKGTLIFTNSTGDGLVLGDSIQLDGLEINCEGSFTGTMLKHDGELGERTYPSTATFTNLVISSNTENQIDCLFDFKPYRNYGVQIENVKLGKQGDVRKADYGFYCASGNWINGISIKSMIIDIYGTDITPFYLNNSNNINNSRWTIDSLYIQARVATYINFAYIKNFNSFTIMNSGIYDATEGTINSDDYVVYDHCAYVNILGNGFFRLSNAKIANPVSSTDSYEGYYSGFNGSSRNNLFINLGLTSSSYTDKIVPILFPCASASLTNRNEIEIMMRYGSNIYGAFMKCISNCGSSTSSTWYNRNFYLEANKYEGSAPIIHKIENVYEGTIIWIKGGLTCYYYAKAWSTPSIAIGKTVTELGTGTTKVLAAIDIDESTTWLPKTTYPLFFWGDKIIDSTTFSNGE